MLLSNRLLPPPLYFRLTETEKNQWKQISAIDRRLGPCISVFKINNMNIFTQNYLKQGKVRASGILVCFEYQSYRNWKSHIAAGIKSLPSKYICT